MTADLHAAIAWLDSHINYERNGPGNKSSVIHDPERRLRHVEHLTELLDDPQRKFSSIHITGTNGKTSTARMITQLVLAQGLRAGSYTSPHLHSINERIAVNAVPIDDGELADLLESVRLIEVLLDLDEQPSYFEIMTAAAFRHFADAPVDVGVIEVGAGGMYDATNVIDASVAVVTNIGVDHLEYLGPAQSDIARHKAGIVKPGATLVTAEQNAELFAILDSPPHERTLALGRDFELIENKMAVGGRLVSVRTPYATYDEVFVAAHGAHQGINAATAIVAAEAFFETALGDAIVREAFTNLTTPGRFEIVAHNPTTVVDGAHNVEGIDKLRETLDEDLASLTERIFVIGMLAPHDPAELLRALGAANAKLVVACTAPSPRAIPAGEIAEAASVLGVPVVMIEDPRAAVLEARKMSSEDSVVVVTGSLYVVGATRASDFT